MNAVRLLAEACAAGLRVRVAEDGKVRVAGPSAPELLDRLRTHKLALAELLTGRACRRCGGPIVDGRPDWLAFADGTAAHVRCEDEQEIARVRRVVCSPETLGDPAEGTMKGEPG